MRYTRRRSAEGFTFIELMVVTAIISVILLALYAMFDNGIKIWQQVNKPIPKEDVDIFFDKFAYDLRNTFKMKGVNFTGAENIFEFAALVTSSRLDKRTVGRVVYFYDTQAEAVKRKRMDFSDIYNRDEGEIEDMLKNVKSLRFQYYFYDTQTKEYLWQQDWLNEEPPIAVEITLEFYDGSKLCAVTRTIGVPLASMTVGKT
ncbi:MAG: prepilin-type N-terminal cleavage/methylation domain-containing protein [Candidatus Omnitrophica bacterium]|nr:prepilin-type N-terminal cleavage/methylation domain-containing protein [Candidatus Omnitrophota bacterium]